MSGSFKIDLWEGTKNIYLRYDSGKRTLKDIISVLKERANAEDRYAQTLTNIVTKAGTLREPGTAGTAWMAVRESQKDLAEAHASVAKTLSEEVVKPLEQLKKANSQQKNRIASDDRSLHSELARQKSNVEKLKDRYLKTSEQAELASKHYQNGLTNQDLKPKELKALESSDKRLASDAARAHTAYKEALDELVAFQTKFETDMKTLLDELQEMEEKRLERIEEILKKYVSGQEEITAAKGGVNEKLRGTVDVIDTVKDLQSWIESEKTGLVPDEPVAYVPYEKKFDGAAAEDLPEAKKGLFSGLKGKPKRSKKPSKNKGGSSAPASPSPGGSSSGASKASGGGKKKFGGKPDAVRKAKAMFDFDATDDNEISFKAGDIVNIHREDSSGWWEGEIDGKLGLLPGNYVQILDDAAAAGGPAGAGAVTSGTPSGGDGGGAAGGTPDGNSPAADAAASPPPGEDSPASGGAGDGVTGSGGAADAAAGDAVVGGGDDDVLDGAPGEVLYKCRVLFDFAASDTDELTISVGETISIHAEVEGWLTATNATGDYGMIPANYVEKL